MKRMMKGFIVVGALVMGSTAFAADKAGQTNVNGAIVPSDEKALLERLHYANQQEIKQAQLALRNSQNADVKAFAEQMVQQHTAADQKLLAYAQTKKMKLADAPKPMDDAEKRAMAANKANLENLELLKDKAFDSAYLAVQLGAHDAVLAKIAAGNQAIDGDAQLSVLITEVTQNVAQHRQHVYALLGKTGPQGAVGGSGAAGTTPGTPPRPAPAQPRK